MNKLLKPLGNGKMILTEEEMLKEINAIKVIKRIPVQNKHPDRVRVVTCVKEDSELSGKLDFQDGWIKYCNKKGYILANASTYYKTAKTGFTTALEKLKKDFLDDSTFVITGTRINYLLRTAAEAEIIDYYGSKVINFSLINCLIDDYSSGTPLRKVLSNQVGLDFVSKLLDTKDSAKKIIENLEILSGKLADQIYIKTPNQQARQASNERAVYFAGGKNAFGIICAGLLEERKGIARIVQSIVGGSDK